MDEKTLFVNFWMNESKTTGKVLSRIPDGSDYRPDPKSRTARAIAWQIVCEEKMLIDALESGKAVWEPPPVPATMREVSEAYEKQSPGMARRLEVLPSARWDGPLEFFGSQRPASSMAWSFLSISCTIVVRSRRISGRWDRRCRKSTGRARTNRNTARLSRRLTPGHVCEKH